MSGQSIDALTDPIDVVVALITSCESSLDETSVAAVVSAVAGGRAQRRRLARALMARPSVLTDGRSPAPRVVGNLLIALRNAGATVVSAPRCAECAKDLRTLQRRGNQWYCSICAGRFSRRACVSCGQERQIASLDRRGQPRCDRCPDGDEGDPVAVLAELIC